MNATDTIQRRLFPSRLAPAAARGALAPLGGIVSEDTLKATELLVSELVTNAVRHAGLRSEDWIDMRVEVLDDRVRVSVTDPGHGFARPPPDPRPDRSSGWGLFLVGQIADRWGLERERETAVWFEIERRSPIAAAGR
jgi:anti-sigma regulatory factor (Ser/Thr protein kinase)